MDGIESLFYFYFFGRRKIERNQLWTANCHVPRQNTFISEITFVAQIHSF
jgi:hypothetical protein